MITIIPALEIMKAVTDLNINGDGGENRRKAFDEATDLISLADASVLIEGQIFARVSKRLNDDHQQFWKNTYRVDTSTVGVEGYNGNIIKSLNWVASSESKATKVIIITENIQNFAGIASANLKAIVPSEFVQKAKKAKQLHASNTFATLDDALIAIFFIF